ncbi:MAG: GTP-binding protein TypA [Deltaproteobacteria bacterium GWC2_42_11]|nr:MAG: GTP-binding protein TypA [Deltaproteobacteria bacterium GWC2_42_11]HBO84176.1 translational GTPase TypA [Deltaproteobacteria bacterium]
MSNTNIRNIAIIAHVDHGKTTLVDGLLKQSGTFRANQEVQECVMDSNALERERGITILAKNTAVNYNGYHINIVDTPGHADFGGEVERILKMVDSALVLVDAVDGPMPQTKFVVSKALKLGLKPIVVVNKIDREGARPDVTIDLTFDLFCQLGATDEQLDFPIIYASARNGYAVKDLSEPRENLTPLFETIIAHVPPPGGNLEAPLQMLVTNLEYDNYIGRIAIGKISNGRMTPGSNIARIKRDGGVEKGKITNILGFHGLKRFDMETASAGEIVAVAGLEDIEIGETIGDAENPIPLLPIDIDEPTLNVEFVVNNSPFAGREGKFITSRHLRARLLRELRTNIALKVEETENGDVFKVSGRGELHLSILMETMRREGYEFAVSKPQVILKKMDGQTLEPYEQLTVDVDSQYQGVVIEKLGMRKGEMLNMAVVSADGRVRIEYKVPARGLIGLQTELMTETKGTCIMHHNFDKYGPYKGEIPSRANGVLISMEEGEATAYAFYNLLDRGKFFIEPGTRVYEGMITGIHAKDNDIVINPMKSKKLTNMRASGSDDSIILPPAIRLSLEQALEFIAEDELVEITPKSIRLRKKILSENERKQAGKR